jgi:hypothetical protein
MKHYGWAIKRPKGGYIFCSMFGWFHAVEECVLFWDSGVAKKTLAEGGDERYVRFIRAEWKKYYRRGYRCVKVKLFEVE